MRRTLLKVKKLEKFIEKYGEDSFVSQSISKMLDYKIKEYDEEIKRLNKELRMFERTYGMKSSVFYRKFSEGRVGDNMDFVEWSSIYQMHKHLLEKKVELEGKK